jgi:hypothetical protein
MKVKELVELLKYYDQEAEVFYTYNYGDYWRTQVASKVRDAVTGQVTWSEYHRMHKIVEEDYDAEEDVREGKEVVIID